MTPSWHVFICELPTNMEVQEKICLTLKSLLHELQGHYKVPLILGRSKIGPARKLLWLSNAT